MNVLLLGGGGREHALARKISESSLCKGLYIMPGNPGTAMHGINLDGAASNFEAILTHIKDYKIHMLVVGPEEPLVKGIYDTVKEAFPAVTIIGPDAKAAQLEGSKDFAKAFMAEYNIPTAAFKSFDTSTFDEGLEYLRSHSLPVVLKADGLAAGKGVVICESSEQAADEFTSMLKGNKFGEAGSKVVVEEYLTGIEMSVFVLTDGKGNYALLPEAKDYKRVGEGDTGLNTGGMGAVSPVPFFSDELKEKVIRKIIEPTMAGILDKGWNYTGFIFFGLMISDGEPYMIEYNCRMGDPETEVVMPRLKNDLLELFTAAANHELHKQKIEVDGRTAVATVAVSGGYPGDFTKGKLISGLDTKTSSDTFIYQAGTTAGSNDPIQTSGGRVLVSVGMAENVQAAAEASRYALQNISFEGMQFRKDIGYEFINSAKPGACINP